jgi:hypothetical protein
LQAQQRLSREHAPEQLEGAAHRGRDARLHGIEAILVLLQHRAPLIGRFDVIGAGAFVVHQLRLHGALERLPRSDCPRRETEVTLRGAALILSGARVHCDTRLGGALIVLEGRPEAVDLGRHDLGVRRLAEGGRERRAARAGRRRAYLGRR